MHYLRLLATYFRLGLLHELQYRSNFWINLLQSMLGIATALGGLGVVFRHTDTIRDWRLPDLLVLVGIYFIMSGVIRTLIQPSMEAFLESVRRGTLDFTLTKPEDAQFLVSIQRISLWSLFDVALGIGVIVYAFAGVGVGVGAFQAFGFLVALLAGIVIVYSFWLMLATCAFWFIKIENILVIFQSMYQAGRWPVNIYPLPLRLILTFVVPVAFAVTVPAEALVGRMTITTLLLALAVSVGLALVSRWFWSFGIRHYSGASA